MNASDKSPGGDSRALNPQPGFMISGSGSPSRVQQVIQRHSLSSNENNTAELISRPQIGQSYRISNNMSQVSTVVISGTMHVFASSTSKSRVCCLLRGRVQVILDDGPAIDIDAFDVFRIPPGTDCTVTNEEDVDAVLQVTTELVHLVIVGVRFCRKMRWNTEECIICDGLCDPHLAYTEYPS
ncbi:hypothetical protein QBC47DRAFT_373314 [Echria macrotheca]|uniref:(S)-ureidoglycine aminohydrolase cupin domain-containing protein n=1 Tax=Echria macrotheca TaxID=438768 RepID=A0AAJ0FE18_9PEZI|nr:hypothetical protein QBC47DRAFT_373314 [Echria macrotheca]